VTVIQLRQGQIEWGGRALLQKADLLVQAGEKIGIIGRNGEGKSTLLAALAGRYPLDGGNLWIDPTLRRAFLPQEPELPTELSCLDYLLATNPGVSEQLLPEEERWSLGARAEALCDQLAIPAQAIIATLSGGQRKRLAVAATLLHDAQLLFLDEPTNHMDLEGIETLERTLRRFRGTLLFITHDRRFLENLCTRIIELDRGNLRSFPGRFSVYLQRKEKQLAAETAAWERQDQELASEEAWARQGVKARAKRNQGRLRHLEALRKERQQRIGRLEQSQIRIQEAEGSGKLVAELDKVSLRFGDRQILQNFSTRIERGDRVGIIGPNGSGKTTLLRLILGEIAPDQGCVRQGTRLQIAYFDQLRQQLDPESRVMDVIADGNDFLEVDGERRHVLGYLQEFLFPPDRARGPVKALSGGERARLLLARLFARPANLLVLDEPTNDLDLDSLEVLEERLQRFPGTVLLVSHDREFLDQVVTQSIVHLHAGNWLNLAGGHNDYLAWLDRQGKDSQKEKAHHSPASPPTERKRAAKGLGFRERMELEQLPNRIEELEQEQQKLAEALADPANYQDKERVLALQAEAQRLAEQLQLAFERWEFLAAKEQERMGSASSG